jgi:CheY-like chemotaxis protein
MGCEPASILIVEDEEAHAELTERAIRKAGNANRIDVVSDGEQALDFLFNRGKYADPKKYPCPGLILLDIKLPGVDGLEVLKQIKEHSTLRKIPVIMLTTSEREEDIARSYCHHANSYLTKPVGFKEFEEKVRQIDFYWLILNEPPSSIE